MTSSPAARSAGIVSRRKWWWYGLKWGLCVTVLIFVGQRAWGLWQRDEWQHLSLSPGWLMAALLAYLAGWLPSAWYWRHLMRQFGCELRLSEVLRSYYCGHLGKYVPGKAGVLLIRAGMIPGRKCRAAVSAVTAAVETLLMMGTGLALGLAFFPLLNWPPVLSEYVALPIVVPLVVAVLLLAGLPLIALLLRQLAWVMTPRDLSGEQRVGGVNTRLVAVGIGVFCLSWTLHGLSLGLTLRAFSPESAGWHQWGLWSGSVALATALGFIAVFAPGGIGVREGLLIEILRVQPGIGEREAVSAAVLLRLIWVVAEILAAVALYYLVKPDSSPIRSQNQQDNADALHHRSGVQ